MQIPDYFEFKEPIRVKNIQVVKSHRTPNEEVAPFYAKFITTVPEGLPSSDHPISPYLTNDDAYDIGYSNDAKKDKLLSKHLPDLSKAIFDSSAILDLEEDWDEEGANATNKETYDNAIKFVRLYALWLLDSGAKLSTPSISIVRDGSIAVSWDTLKAKFIIVFDKKNHKISYCYGKDKVNGIPLETGIENNDSVDKSIAEWMKKRLRK